MSPATLATTEYGPSGGTEVLAVHGITSNGRAFATIAALLPGHRILAPDLRGRGRSGELPGPFGLRRHAEDLAGLLDDAGGSPRIVVGHSMGAFVAVVLAGARPDLVERLVLVDGGLPLELPPGKTPDDIAEFLGPAAERLAMRFADEAAYLGFWRAHPALGPELPAGFAEYARYDLVGEPPGLRASASAEAMLTDGAELYGPDWYLDALASLRMPVTVLRAPRGLTDGAPLYPPGALESFRGTVPQMRVVEVPDVNHYTIVFTRAGADAVAAAITGEGAS
ncbi:MAG: alpha/beta fold hydrolase [Microbacteriaceae bacterium]|nr:alpha/beta fold hydrolase [Microbacteriaceae bacterium]